MTSLAAARALGVSIQYVKQMIRAGRLPATLLPSGKWDIHEPPVIAPGKTVNGRPKAAKEIEK